MLVIWLDSIKGIETKNEDSVPKEVSYYFAKLCSHYLERDLTLIERSREHNWKAFSTLNQSEVQSSAYEIITFAGRLAFEKYSLLYRSRASTMTT